MSSDTYGMDTLAVLVAEVKERALGQIHDLELQLAAREGDLERVTLERDELREQLRRTGLALKLLREKEGWGGK